MPSTAGGPTICAAAPVPNTIGGWPPCSTISIAERSRRSLAAGCDLVLHCNGVLSEMDAVASQCPQLAGEALARTARASASRRAADDLDLDAARAELADLIAQAAVVA